MAANTSTSKRVAVKWIRDRAKGAYKKDTVCHICGSTEDLELHHTHGLTNLYDKWVIETGYTIETDEDIIKYRDEFIRTFHKEVYEDVFTLCLKHHRCLHSIYGKSPLLNTASKQLVWIARQKDKHNGVQDSTDAPNKVAGFSILKSKPSTGRDSKKLGFSSFY